MVFAQVLSNVEMCTSCGPSNDIISLFGPRLKKFADPCTKPIGRAGDRIAS